MKDVSAQCATKPERAKLPQLYDLTFVLKNMQLARESGPNSPTQIQRRQLIAERVQQQAQEKAAKEKEHASKEVGETKQQHSHEEGQDQHHNDHLEDGARKQGEG